jgi:hypothetical protein
MNYNISSKKDVSDSLFTIKQELLEHLFDNATPMYPNAISTLATMKEESQWHDIESSFSTLDKALQEFDRCWGPLRGLYTTAVHAATANEWYPSSSLATSYSYEHELLQMCNKEEPSDEINKRLCECVVAFMEAVRRGSEVFVKFQYNGNHDEELFKDLDDIISKMNMMFQGTKHISQTNQRPLCYDLARIFDNLLILFSGKTLPSKWSKCFLACLKMFSKETRHETILNLDFSSKILSESKLAMIEYKKSVLLNILESPSLVLSGQDEAGRRKRRRYVH